MSIFSWVGKLFTLDQKDTSPWRFFGGGSAAGKAVTPTTALQLATVWACIRLTSQAVAMLPLGMHEKQADGGRKAISDHPLAEILGDSPNAEMTGLEFWEAATAWLCAYGNSYAEIVRSGDRVVALNLLASDRTWPVRDADGNLTYEHNDRGKREAFPPERVLHIKGFGFGGDLGLSPISFGGQTFGNAIAAEEAAGKMLGAGLMPSGVLTTAAEIIDEEQRTQIEESMKRYVGSQNAAKMMVLEAGMKFDKISLDPVSTELLATRRYDVESICRFFGCPPIIVGHAAEGQTMWGSGVEAILLQWLVTGLNPFLIRIERRIRKQLISPAERARVYAEFNREGLLQADSAAKIAFLSTAVQNALMDRNEARAKLNLPGRPGGDVLTAQTNLAPLDQLGAGGAANDVRETLRSFLGLEEKSHVSED
jgi:HK97 family phage portal protein